jgi:signal transduction histidine kinase/DNA-binding LacI/PurR family transcriptional regulator/DNA-binding response OmpR family regulator
VNDLPGSLLTSSTARATIGLLTHGAGDPNNRAIWSGVAEAAREHGVNLICFPGKPVRSLIEFEAQSNVIYDLVDTCKIDGLVIWLAGLTLRVDVAEIQEFCARYSPLPMAVIGTLLEGIPSVLVDNYNGMREVLNHLVQVHGRRRIAYVRGPEQHQEAEERYRAYLDVLGENGLPFDAELVVPGYFKESGGVKAAEILLDERRARFDALAAASDNMAIGALKLLLRRGIGVPEEVAVAGLNDEIQSQYITPPLTTAPLHFYEQGRQALKIVLALLDGREVPSKVVLPTDLLIRQSCGCPDPLVMDAALDLSAPDQAPAQPGELAQAGLSLGLAGGLDEPAFLVSLQEALQAEIAGAPPGRFLSLLAEGLRFSTPVEELGSRWQRALSALRRSVSSGLSGLEGRRAENLFSQARVAVGETAQRAHAYRAFQVEQQLLLLGELNQKLSITMDRSELAQVLAQALRRLNIPSCYLSLYEDPEAPAGMARLIAAYSGSGLVELDPGGVLFPACELAPDGFLPEERQYSLVVEPLYFREDQLGFVLFEAEPREEEIYAVLQEQISGALKRTLLIERNLRLYVEAVEARQAAENANLLKSRFLSMVSHELRTPLSLIVGTIEMMLAGEKVGAQLPEIYLQDMDCIRASAQHLFRLIGDVLDLASSQAGELRLACEPLDLAQVLGEAALLGETLAREKGLEWRAEIPARLPPVSGDRTRLRQVTLNLISNAVKFTERGEIALKVEETEAGDGVRVEVSDTGMGIPADEQDAIFDEFRRSERSVARGYGGMGLGLAITRRLIELHGGEISLHSTGEDGEGSTFVFTLPALPGRAPDGGQAQPREQSVLLLVEDLQRAEKLQEHLAGRGFEVSTLEVGKEPDWLAQVIASPPGAVVLDFQPAAEGGWELMQALKENRATRDIPVLFYSLSAGEERGSVLELDYWEKPLGEGNLALLLEGLGWKAQEEGRAILVVDDEPGILDLHVRLLESRLPGYRILAARDGREALEVMGREPLDLVLLDLMMPGMDGFEVLAAMRAREATRSLPVIVLTAQILTGPEMARLQGGVAAVLGKGLFSAEEVLAQVEGALNRSKRLGGEAQRLVRRAMAYIHEHYAEPVTRVELAARLAVSERHLTRCFHEEMGIPPITYLNRFRIRQAKTMLETGHTNLTEVAQAVGFSDSNYFGRVFREEVGVSPGAFVRGKRV